MANLKQDLDEYMLMNEERKTSKLSYKMPNFQLPSFLKSSSEGSSSSNSWLNDNTEDDSWSCCPKLNRLVSTNDPINNFINFIPFFRFQRILASIACLGLL